MGTENNNTTPEPTPQPESLDTILKRQQKERQETFDRLRSEARDVGTEMQ